MLAMYFERLNSGLPLYETIGRTGMLALSCLSLVDRRISVLENM